jgi:hypothetical protein
MENVARLFPKDEWEKQHSFYKKVGALGERRLGAKFSESIERGTMGQDQ